MNPANRLTRRSVRALFAALALAALLGAAEPELEPVASLTELMQAMIIPASNALFDVARNPPADDGDWKHVRNQAIILAESGNLLMIGERAKNDEVWISTSRALIEAGLAAKRAADAKDVDGINDAGNQIIEACEVCHETHWQR